MDYIKLWAEMEIGNISDAEYEKALPYAKHKLQDINTRFHTDHGDRYLALLVSETVNMNRFSAFCRNKKRTGSQYNQEFVPASMFV